MVDFSLRTARPARRRLVGALAVLATLASTLSACASSSDRRADASSPSVRADPALHAKLPAAVRTSGVLRMVTDASYPPASSFGPDGRTIVGFEPDLGKALGDVLGVRVDVLDRDFSTLPDLVNAGRADFVMSAMTDTAEREKKIDFVDYFSAGTSLVVQRGNPVGITGLSGLCGQKVAVEQDTVQADLLAREQQHCGTSPIRIDTRHTNDNALLQLRTGRVAAVPMDFPPAELLTTSQRTSDQYQLASTEQYEPGPYGIGLAKNQTALRDALLAALNQLIENRTYQHILAKWHVETGALRRAAVNMAGGGS